MQIRARRSSQQVPPLQLWKQQRLSADLKLTSLSVDLTEEAPVNAVDNDYSKKEPRGLIDIKWISCIRALPRVAAHWATKCRWRSGFSALATSQHSEIFWSENCFAAFWAQLLKFWEQLSNLSLTSITSFPDMLHNEMLQYVSKMMINKGFWCFDIYGILHQSESRKGS